MSIFDVDDGHYNTIKKCILRNIIQRSKMKWIQIIVLAIAPQNKKK